MGFLHKNEKGLSDYYETFWNAIEKEEQTDEIDEELVSFSTFTSYILNVMFKSDNNKNQYEQLTPVFFYSFIFFIF